MSTTTYYAALGLVPAAAPEVIRAAYKALALFCHPDKTINLTADERLARAAAFNEVQAAYHVLSKPSLRAAYDAELARGAEQSTPFRPASQRRADVPSAPKSKPKFKLTTPEEKAAMRARAKQSLEQLRDSRAERDRKEAQLDMAGLKDMVQIWKQLAEENSYDPAMHAHCAIRIHEYQRKLVERERQHQEWLANMSTARKHSSSSSSSSSIRTPEPRHVRATHVVVSSAVAKDPSPCKAERAAAVVAAAETMANAREEARQAEKAQREAAHKRRIQQKAAAVRADKETQQASKHLQRQMEAARIANARAKAAAAPRATLGAVVVDKSSKAGSSSAVPVMGCAAPPSLPTKVTKVCDKCDAEHANFRQWRICHAQPTHNSR
ncbi:hypothetical protein ACEQ8H_000372 [Pleosporales sp. CAS-2024a]